MKFQLNVQSQWALLKVCFLTFGVLLSMPAFAQLADTEIAALVDFLVATLNGGSSKVDAAHIAAARQKKLSPSAVRKPRGS